MKIAVKTESRAPPEVVFGTHMDIPNWPRFNDAIKKIDILTAGPIAVGMRFRAARLAGGRQISSELKLAVMDAPWRIGFTAEEDGRRLAFTSEIAPNGGGSRLIMSCEIVPVTLGARLGGLFPMLSARGLRKQLQCDINAIAREAERRLRV